MGKAFENKITTSINTYSAGLYPTFGPVSIGATVDYNRLKIKSKFEETQRDINENKDGAWSSRFSISYDFSNGGTLGFLIRPYVQVYWNKYDITEFNNFVNNIEPAEPNKEDFASWGFSFIIYNGEQRR